MQEIEKILGEFKKQTGLQLKSVELRTENVDDSELALFATVKNNEHPVFSTFNPKRSEILNWGWVVASGRPSLKFFSEKA